MMKIRRSSHSASIYRAMLRGVALLVPLSEREEWLAEWRSELWYFRHDRGLAMDSSARLSLSMTRFCLGSFQDALWIRRNCPDAARRDRLWLRSPLLCTTILVALAVLAWSMALFESVLQPRRIWDVRSCSDRCSFSARRCCSFGSARLSRLVSIQQLLLCPLGAAASTGGSF